MENTYNMANLKTLQDNVKEIYEKIINSPGQYFANPSYERGYIEGQLEILKIMIDLIAKQQSGAKQN